MNDKINGLAFVFVRPDILRWRNRQSSRGSISTAETCEKSRMLRESELLLTDFSTIDSFPP
jgi:hypothetical protein